MSKRRSPLFAMLRRQAGEIGSGALSRCAPRNIIIKRPEAKLAWILGRGVRREEFTAGVYEKRLSRYQLLSLRGVVGGKSNEAWRAERVAAARMVEGRRGGGAGDATTTAAAAAAAAAASGQYFGYGASGARTRMKAKLPRGISFGHLPRSLSLSLSLTLALSYLA
jgi:hypothetical protein